MAAKFETPPRFCPIHQTIHVCEEMTITNRLKQAEDSIGARVRRLHGTQTEEEIAAEAKKQTAPEGSIGAILAKAKQKIAEAKKQTNNKEIDEQTKAVSQEEVNDRMAALRARMTGGSDASTTNIGQDLPPSPSSANISNGLGEIINHAKEISNKTWSEYKVPERSRMGEEIASEKTVISEEKEDKANLKIEHENNDVSKETRLAKRESKKMTFSAEETQELIQEAVKKALAEVGLIKKQPTSKKMNSPTKEKPKSNSPTAKKLTSKPVSAKGASLKTKKPTSSSKTTITKKK